MGLFKQMKDMKKTVEAAPAMFAQAQTLGAQAQQMAAAQQTAATMRPAAVAVAGGPDFEPIAGVSIDLYAAISRDCAGHAGDAGHAAMIAAGRGVSGDAWVEAMNGWNARMHNPAVAQRFNQLYTQR